MSTRQKWRTRIRTTITTLKTSTKKKNQTRYVKCTPARTNSVEINRTHKFLSFVRYPLDRSPNNYQGEKWTFFLLQKASNKWTFNPFFDVSRLPNTAVFSLRRVSDAWHRSKILKADRRTHKGMKKIDSRTTSLTDTALMLVRIYARLPHGLGTLTLFLLKHLYSWRDFLDIHKFVKCCIPMHGRRYVLPRLIELSGIVLSCFTLIRYTAFTDVSPTQPEDSPIPFF